MAAVLWTIPLMLLVIAIAIVPILVAARADEAAEADLTRPDAGEVLAALPTRSATSEHWAQAA